MAKLQIDLTGRGGLAPRWWGEYEATSTQSPQRRYLAGTNQMAQGVYNPFNKYGYLSPAGGSFSELQVASSTYSGGLFRCSIIDPVNSNFYIGTGQRLYKGGSYDDVDLSEALDLGSGGTPNILDLEIYQVNEAKKLFVVYETGGNTEIAISNLPYDTGTDNLTWLSATVGGTAGAETLTSHAFIRAADNGFAYLFRDNRVDKIDGTAGGGANGTITNNLLLFPTTHRIADAIDFRGQLYVAIHQYPAAVGGDSFTGAVDLEVGIYVWDRQSAVVSGADYIQVKGAQTIRKIYVSPNGKLRLITENSSRIVEIREWTGSSFETIEEVGRTGYPAFHDSMFSTSNATFWLSQGGRIFAHGKPSHLDKEGLFVVGDTGDAVSGSAVMFTSILPSKMLLSFGSSIVAKYFGLTSVGDGNATKAQGDIYTPVQFLPMMSTVENIGIYMRQEDVVSTSTAATIKIYFNGSSAVGMTKTVIRNDVAKGYVNFEINKPYVNAIQIEIEYPNEVPIAADFNPIMAVAEYTPTTTKG